MKNLSFSTRVIIRSLLGIVPLTLLVAVFLGSLHQKELKEDRRVIRIREQNHVESMETAIEKDLGHVESDLNYLQSLIQNELDKNNDDLNSLCDKFKDHFLLFSRSAPIYEQIRILDENGMELLRIDQKDNQPQLLPDDLLQDKSGRYYYDGYMRLAPGEIYISPFDLNVERGEIEQPENPMIRFAKAIHDRAGHVRGAIMLNYKGNVLLSRLKESLAGQSMLVNRDGFYLYHPDPARTWGFMYPDRANQKIAYDLPSFWTQASTHQQGQFFNDRGLSSYKTIYPLEDVAGKDLAWILIRHLSPENLRALGHRDNFPHWLQFLVLSGLITVICVQISINISKKEDALNEAHISEERYRHLAEQLDAANSMKTLLLDILSHDLRNPAGAITSIAELLHEEIGENELVDLIQQSSASLNKVIQNAGTLAKISMGEDIELQQLDLVEMIRESVGTFEENIKSCGMQLQMELPPNCPVHANPILEEVFKNFTTNAMRYASAEKILHIRLRQDEQSVCVEFADLGETIPEDQRELVFTRGKKLSSASSMGSGLGLNIVHKIAVMHKAEVGVRPNTPKGNIFYIRLPRLSQSGVDQAGMALR